MTWSLAQASARHSCDAKTGPNVISFHKGALQNIQSQKDEGSDPLNKLERSEQNKR